MVVLYYQIGIILSILLCFKINPKYALAAALLWTIWTVAQLYPPLMYLQLGVTWGAFFLARHYIQQNSRIRGLEDVIKAQSSEVQEIIKSEAEDNIRVIAGKDHRGALIDAIDAAQKELFILSGWINSAVVDNILCHHLQKALDRGVQIFIGYGWQDSSGTHSKNEYSEKAIRKLLSLKPSNGGGVHISEFATHEKILVKDENYVIYGSNNWLSNRKFKNSERSLMIFNERLAQDEAKRIRTLISEHHT